MPRGYPRVTHPKLYQTDNSNNNNQPTIQPEATMLTQKTQMNPGESEHNTNERISRIRTTISQATALIKNEHMLKLDSSNFKLWENRLSIILDNFIDDASFLHREGPTLSSDEKICRGILIYSLPEEIQSEILHLWPCKAIYGHETAIPCGH
ncbi:hypothetical protein O181_073749 [Austropuccinia psidii MF-1]|uniref:Uncharacterized protein n=1 Tax=Austropuccinia psidii MF-1 TaxID=1389203 RepID=A0A9Q3F7S0_9BASI|nr:hypothetical protein [Austropuccinia psidii MF-1]